MTALKIMVKRRHAHVRFCRQLLNIQVLGVFHFDLFKYATDQAKVRLATNQCKQRPAARSHQHMIKNFANNLFSQNPRIQRALHHIQQSFHRA